jgi:soluble epoxide hydrolase / lipid-phosphate phosphatase
VGRCRPSPLKPRVSHDTPGPPGFSGSSKPTEPSRYNYHPQANSLAQILDHEAVTGKRVIPLGHDWGSAIAQRFYLYQRDRCIGLCLLSLAYQIPSPEPFDLSTANEITAKRFGYPQWSYWEFFTAPNAPELMRQNLGRFWEVNNGNLPSPLLGENGRDIWMREMFCTKNAMREYITKTGKYKGVWTVPMKDCPNGEKLKQEFIERMSRDEFEGLVCYYHSLANNTMLEDEKYSAKRTKREMTSASSTCRSCTSVRLVIGSAGLIS